MFKKKIILTTNLFLPHFAYMILKKDFTGKLSHFLKELINRQNQERFFSGNVEGLIIENPLRTQKKVPWKSLRKFYKEFLEFIENFMIPKRKRLIERMWSR